MTKLVAVVGLALLLGGCLGTGVKLTPEKGRTCEPLAENAPVAVWLTPRLEVETIIAIQRQVLDVELVPRPKGTRLGEVEVPGTVRWPVALQEARKLGGDAIFVREPDDVKSCIRVQVYRRGR
jgi:hypothetical protein